MSDSDPWLANVWANMEEYLLLERALCSCDDHPLNQDPDCLFCSDE